MSWSCHDSAVSGGLGSPAWVRPKTAVEPGPDVIRVTNKYRAHRLVLDETANERHIPSTGYSRLGSDGLLGLRAGE